MATFERHKKGLNETFSMYCFDKTTAVFMLYWKCSLCEINLILKKIKNMSVTAPKYICSNSDVDKICVR